MAIVYLAWDTEQSREVAIKVLRPELAGSIPVERFLREIRLSETLSHPRIVPLLDSGDVSGLPFLVMPVVSGGSLRDRLLQERQLAVDDAVRITREIAAALDAAHARRVVHRDVKPANILLDDSGAMLSDFGIARAFLEVAREKLTESGIAIGTAGYMSPEQAGGSHDVDARSDVYALAAVTYEMLAGEPPYSGPSAQAVVAKQLALPVPNLSVVRDTLPEGLDDVMQKALAKVPADRYQSAGAFAEALSQAAKAKASALTRLVRRARRRKYALAASALFVLAVVLGWPAARPWVTNLSSDVQRDTTHYVVFAPTGSGAVGAQEDALLAGIRRWTGITVIDARDTPEQASTTSPLRAARTAASMEAGRYLMAQLKAGPGGTTIEARLFNTSEPARPIAVATGTVGSATDVSTVVAAVVDSLLLRDAPTGENLAVGTRSLPARQAHLRGVRALGEWNLVVADSSFDSATRLDGSYAQAHLFLALVRNWSGAEAARWRVAAEQSALGRTRLSAREQLMSDAAVGHARGDFASACETWRTLITTDSLDGILRFGRAHCLVSDNFVVRDPAGPTGWRFRTSYFSALREYQRAFELRPQILAAFGGGGSEAFRRLFKTAGNQLRRGRSATGTVFSGNMEWQGDSLVFYPSPWTGEHISRRFGAVAEAMRHQRELVQTVAASWVAASPTSTDAWLALTEALGELNDPSALDTLARARSQARTPQERFRVAVTEAALQLGFALQRRDTIRLRRTSALADSLLRVARRDDDARALAALAALTGRAAQAARYFGEPASAQSARIPLPARGIMPRLLMYAAFGGPPDTLRVLEQEAVDFIERTLAPEERIQRRLEWSARAASMAFPAHRFLRLDALAADGDPLVALQVALARGDTLTVKQGLALLRDARRDVLAEDLTLDALSPEAALLLAMGDAQGAASWLDPTLSAMPQAVTGLVTSPIQAASLGTALLVRAHAATALGHGADAAFWRRAIEMLWAGADEFLQVRVRAAARAVNTPP